METRAAMSRLSRSLNLTEPAGSGESLGYFASQSSDVAGRSHINLAIGDHRCTEMTGVPELNDAGGQNCLLEILPGAGEIIVIGNDVDGGRSVTRTHEPASHHEQKD